MDPKFKETMEKVIENHKDTFEKLALSEARDQIESLKAELKQVIAIGVEMQREINRKLSKKNDDLEAKLTKIKNTYRLMRKLIKENK